MFGDVLDRKQFTINPSFWWRILIFPISFCLQKVALK